MTPQLFASSIFSNILNILAKFIPTLIPLFRKMSAITGGNTRRRPAKRSNGVGKEMGMIGSTESASIMQLMSNMHMYSKGWTHVLQ
jgi:hypothetical protein